MTSTGTPGARLEDDRLLRGVGRFVDDVDRPGQRWMRVIRSPVAHARIVAVRTDAAIAAPGVHVLLIGEDLAHVPPIPLRTAVTVTDLTPFLQPVLARDRVRYVGEPVAVLLADDPYRAEDAAELVDVEYEDLPCVVDPRLAAQRDSPLLRTGKGNEAALLEVGYGEVESAFEEAAHVVRTEVVVGRHSAVPLETRGLVAAIDPSGRLEMWGMTKVPHFNRRAIAEMLGVEIEGIRLHQSDAGGGFGVRGELYPEDVLVAYLTLRTRHPVKWVEDRHEHLIATNHSRDQRHAIEAAFDEEGRLLALRDEIWHDNGAYMRTHGVIVPDLTASMLPGPYRVPAYRCTVHVVLTNKTPCGTYRAPGRFEGTFARERLLDIAAEELGIDRVALRMRNLLGPAELPHSRDLTAIGTDMVLDAADYPGLLEETLAAAGFEDWKKEAAAGPAQGKAIGCGIALFLEKSGLGPYEAANVAVMPEGEVVVAAGATSLGQGVETALARIAAERLGVAIESVRVVLSDTDIVPDGVGSWASRSTVVAGSAVFQAADAVADQIRRRAAEVLEVAPVDIVLDGGRAYAVGSPTTAVSIYGLARASPDPTAFSGTAEPAGSERALSAARVFSVERMTYPYGVHLAQVELDEQTGEVRVARYFIGYEVGKAIDRALVEAQLVGGASQGIGGSLLEEFLYDESGQPLCVTFAEYLLPTAGEVPHVETLVTEAWPSPTNPLGARGAGEGGVSACGAAISSAIADALRSAKLVRRLPVGPERAWRLATRRTMKPDIVRPSKEG